jgi:hypothetical protein
MMSGEALAAALQGARDPTDTAYRELVETLITEVEVRYCLVVLVMSFELLSRIGTCENSDSRSQ